LLASVTLVLFSLLVVQVSFDTLPWLSPETASETLILYALSTINLLAFLVILMVLVRNLIKLRRERIEQRLGARFKTRIVLFFVSLTLLPVLFLFFASYGLINRSVDKWFSLPASEMVKNAREIQAAYVDSEREQLKRAASTVARLLGSLDPGNRNQALAAEYANLELTTAVLSDAGGETVAALGSPVDDYSEEFKRLWQQARSEAEAGRTFAAQVIEGFKPVELIASAPLAGGGWIAMERPVPSDLAARTNEKNRKNNE